MEFRSVSQRPYGEPTLAFITMRSSFIKALYFEQSNKASRVRQSFIRKYWALRFTTHGETLSEDCSCNRVDFFLATW